MIEATIAAVLTPFFDDGKAVDLGLMDEHVAWLHERGIRCVSAFRQDGRGPSPTR